MLYVWLGAQLVGPIGSLFLLAGRAMRKRSPRRWLWQLAPLVYPVLFLAGLELFG